MATESAADPEISVAHSSSLSEWLNERAAVLGVDRETLLVQLLEQYQTAAGFENEDIEALLSEIAAEEATTVDRSDFDELAERVDSVDESLSENVEDLRGRILQLKDAVEARTLEDDHREIEAVSERIEDLSTEFADISTDLEALETDIDGLRSELESDDDRLETAETRLHRLAQVVLELRRHSDRTSTTTEELDRLRRVANENGTTAADCGSCGERLQIGLLTEAACPHCGEQFHDIEYSSSILGRFKTPTLTGSDPTSLESESESDLDSGADDG